MVECVRECVPEENIASRKPAIDRKRPRLKITAVYFESSNGMRVTLWVVLPIMCAACGRAAVCLVGHARSFMQSHIRRLLQSRLVASLGCEVVDLFLYVAIEDPAVTTRRSWDRFSRAPASSETAVRAAARELGALVVIDREEQSYASAAHSQLAKVAACWRHVEQAELARGRYDWIVRARPDLAWLEQPPPLSLFPADRVYVPAHYWPLADQFALVPRRFASSVFGAFDALETASNCTDWQVPGAGVPESAVYRRLVDEDVPVQVYDGFIYVIARYFEGGACASLHLARSFACAIIAADPEQCHKALFRAYAARCRATVPATTESTAPASLDDLLPLRHLRDDLRLQRSLEEPPDAPLVLTTSGWDQGRVVAQLAMSFRPDAHLLRSRLKNAFARFVDNLLDEPLWQRGTPQPVGNASLELHALFLDLWRSHVGTARCVPACVGADVTALFETPRPFRLMC